VGQNTCYFDYEKRVSNTKKNFEYLYSGGAVWGVDVELSYIESQFRIQLRAWSFVPGPSRFCCPV
jgi:hypothetical protein